MAVLARVTGAVWGKEVVLHLFRISTLIVKLPWLGSIETTVRAQKPVFLQDRYTSGQKKYWRLSSSSLWPAPGFWKWEAAKIDIRTKNFSSGERSEDRWADSLVRAPVFPASMWTPWRILVLKQTYLLVFLFRSEENALRTKEFEICLPETTVMLTPHQAK